MIVRNTFILCCMLLLSACEQKAISVQEVNFHNNIEGVTNNKLSSQYWIDKLDQADKVLMSTEQLLNMSEQQFTEQTYLKNPLSYDSQLTRAKLTELIYAISTPSKYDRFYPDGRKLTADDYQVYLDEMALDKLQELNKVRFALVTKRAAMRMLPTLDRVLNSGMDFDIDRFQETAGFPGEALAVLHISRSGEWAFVQNYHYRAWIQTKHIAFADKSVVAEYIKQQDKQFLLVTGDKISTNFDPYDDSISQVQLDMGVRLPRVTHQEFGEFELNRLNTYTNHIVKLPIRDKDGNLEVKSALIAKSNDVSLDYLAFTKRNIIQQAFKFLGERYGWGHDFNGRDCTGFVGEIYKTFGLLMPRNSGQQGNAEYGKNQTFAKDASVELKMPYFEKMQVGDLLYLPGHVAMFLGYADGKPFLIHDVHGLSYENSAGETVKGILNGVSVTPLLPFTSYLKRIYNIKSIR